MYPKDAIEFFSSRKAVAAVCDVTETAVHHWIRKGWIPYDKQCLIQLEAAKVQGKKKYPVASKRHVPAQEVRAA